MRISLRHLTELCQDPKSFAKMISQKPTKKFGKTRGNYLRFAIDKYHKGLPFEEAEKYLENSITENFKSQKGSETFLHQFRIYVERTNQLNSTVVKVRDKIEVPIRQKLQPFYQVKGQLARLDLTDNGYGLWFLSTKTGDWSSDWRLPIVTASYQIAMGVNPSELTVGVYDFETGTYSTHQFSETQLTKSLNKLNESLEVLLNLGIK